MFILKKLSITIFLSFLGITCFAQEPKQHLDFVNQQMAEQLLNNIKALSSPELIKAQAEYYRKMYDALLESGFNKEQALSIITAMASSNK